MKFAVIIYSTLLAVGLAYAQATATDQLLRDISNPDKYVRIRSLEQLSRLTPDDRVVFAITEALRDQDESVRVQAASSLARLGADAVNAEPELLRALDDSSVNVQSAAARALGQMRAGGDAALPRLRLLATEERFTIRRTAAEALALIGADRVEVIRLLKILLNDSEDEVRRNALEGLLSLYSPEETVEFVANVMQDQDAKTRMRAYVKLRDITHLAPGAMPLIVRGLDDASPEVQYAAISAVEGRLPAANGVVEALSRIVNDDRAWIRNRIRAAHAVGPLGDQARPAEEALTAALDVDHPTLQATARQALVRIGVASTREVVVPPNWNDVSGSGMHSAPLPSPEELDQWIAAINGPDIRRRYTVVEDLAAIGPAGAKAAPALANALREGFMRHKAIEALQNIGEPAIPALTPLFEDPNPTVRQDALKALAKPGRDASPTAAIALARATQSEFERVRRTAIEGLASMRSSAHIAVPALISALEMPSERVAAIHSLMSFRGQAENIVPAVAPFVEDSDPLVVGASVQALHLLSPQSQTLLPLLAKALGNSTGQTHEYLIRTLASEANETPESVAILFDALEGSSPRSRALITRALAVIATSKPRPNTFSVVFAKLSRLLTDTGSEVRAEALRAIDRLGPDAASTWPAVETLLGDPSQEVRAQAIRTIKTLAAETGKTDQYVLLVIPLLEDPHNEVRESAAFNLGMTGTAARMALPSLRNLLDDPSKKVRDAARFAIGNMSDGRPKQL